MKKILAVAVVLLMAVSAQASVTYTFNAYNGGAQEIANASYVPGLINLGAGVQTLAPGISVDLKGGPCPHAPGGNAVNTINRYGIGPFQGDSGDTAYTRFTSFTVTSDVAMESVMINQLWNENSLGAFTYLASATSPINGPQDQNMKMQGTFSNGNKLFTLTSQNSAYTAGGAVTVIPEPATMSLLVLGGIATLLKRRNRA